MLSLLALALIAMVALGSAARNWTAIWRGFGEIAMSVDAVRVSEDRRTIFVDSTFVNQSDQQLRIHVLETGVRLSGRSITAGSARYDQQLLEPGESVALQTSQRVQTSDLAVVDRGEGVWNVSGRVQVSVVGLGEPLWLPFRYDVDVAQ